MKGIIDILGIVLPALLLGLFFLRSKSKAINIIGALLIVVLLLVGVVRYLFFGDSGSNHSNAPDPVRLSAGKHSEAFNQAVQSVLDTYYGMTEGFVNWDTVAVNKNVTDLSKALDNIKLEELQKDTAKDASALYQTAAEYISSSKNKTTAILQEQAIDKKRELLTSLSDDLRLFLISVEYDQAKLYWQECPMAFGDDAPGNWLSKTADVRNPYLGTKHPRYKAEMLNCGGPKATIDFTPKDTITK